MNNDRFDDPFPYYHCWEAPMPWAPWAIDRGTIVAAVALTGSALVGDL